METNTALAAVPAMHDYVVPSTLAGMLALANQIEQLLTESGGELSPEIDRLMMMNDKATPGKVDAIVFILKRMEAGAEMFKEEAERYAKVAKALANSQARLKAYVKGGMLDNGLTELVGTANRFALTNGRDTLVIESVEKLPDLYTVPVVTREPNKDLIRAQLEAGAVIPGARLEPVKQLRSYAVKPVKESKSVKA